MNWNDWMRGTHEPKTHEPKSPVKLDVGKATVKIWYLDNSDEVNTSDHDFTGYPTGWWRGEMLHWTAKQMAEQLINSNEPVLVNGYSTAVGEVHIPRHRVLRYDLKLSKHEIEVS